MARAIEFDAAKARYKALLLFWQRGYQATSLPDLLAAMDISRSSFYAAFGCKRALFVACMDLFAERTQRVLLTARAEKTPLEALEFFFERHLSRPARGRASLGCMLVNTVLELAGVDDDASDRASRHLADTGVVVANHGLDLLPVFFGDMTKLAWPGQFNLDFTCMLALSGLWVAWRHRFGAAGVVLGLAAFFGGALFLSAYLLVESFRADGDIGALLLGRARTPADRRAGA